MTPASEAPVSESVYLDVSIGGAPAGRLVVGLFGGELPKTVANYAALARGSGEGVAPGMGFKGSKFHRVIKGFMAQGGGLYARRRPGGGRAYMGRFSQTRRSCTATTCGGWLSMANSGKDRNGSQFFITFGKTAWLDGKHVVFGRVTDGLDVLDKIEAVKTASADRPVAEILVTDCGVLPSA
uniref:Peptidyl-prolyl cis-trans isomerase n=1 Tax=Pyropia seriata TaxID=79731 RepID=A0A166QAA5_9RHOD|nr:cyclophilin 5 [Neoporphyra seriata]